MVHAFVPQHLIDLAEYLKTKNFSDKNYDLQCINRTIVNRAYLSTYLHTQDWIINNGPYNDIKEYSKSDVGYHTAILIALTKLNKHYISGIYEEFIELRVDAVQYRNYHHPKRCSKGFGFSFPNPKSIALKLFFLNPRFKPKAILT